MHANSQPATLSEGKYLYAITNNGRERRYDVPGIDSQAVYAVCHGRVAAVASNCSRAKIRPERAHLAAHKAVLERLMLDSTVLPMAFGIIADDLRAVKRMLAGNEEDFAAQLARVAGKVELGLRVVWEVPNIFEYFIDHHPELRVARDQLLGGHREPRQEEKLELGRFFEQLLTEDREAHFREIEEVLAPCCEAIKRSSPRQVQEVVNLNLLVRRDRLKDLDEAVLAASSLFDNNYAFDLNGPWAPHNFVDMDLRLSNAGRVEQYALP
jgi:hypothetical protein